jgi:hypothetical protein
MSSSQHRLNGGAARQTKSFRRQVKKIHSQQALRARGKSAMRVLPSRR